MGRMIIPLFLAIFLISNLLIMGFLWSQPSEDSVKEVKCYDRRNNEIQGLECEQEIGGFDLKSKIILSLIAELVIVTLSIGMSKNLI